VHRADVKPAQRRGRPERLHVVIEDDTPARLPLEPDFDIGRERSEGELAREVHEQIKKVFGPKLFNTVITKSVRLEESPAYKESIFSFAPNSSGAIEYGNLCDEVMKRV